MQIASKYCENIISFSYNHYYSPDAVSPIYLETYLDYIENGYVLEDSAPSDVTELEKNETADGTVISWNESTDNIGIAYYRIEKNGKFLSRVEMCFGESDLYVIDSDGKADDVYTVTSFDAAGNASNPVSV